MSDEFESDLAPDLASAANAPPSGVGQQLRAARVARGLSLAQVAAETRIGVGNLEAIEAGEFNRLPGRIYAIAFSKSYAKLVGLDQGDVAELVRAELGDDPAGRGFAPEFAPGDPARAPTRKLVWASAGALVVLIIGLYFAAKVLLDPAAQLPTLTQQEAAEQAAAQAAQAGTAGAAAQPAAAGGAVVLTADEAVWLRITDANDQRLKEGELAAGESYTVPADAAGPKIITGRPNALSITVGGRAVPRLAEDLRTVVDVPIDAASLLARPAPGATPGAAPAPSATPTAARARTTVD